VDIQETTSNERPDSPMLLLVGRCLTPFQEIHNAAILCRGGMIHAVGGASAFRGVQDVPQIHAPDDCAIPGMVDTHIHGAGATSVMASDTMPDLVPMSQALAAHGVTTFLPTVISAPREEMRAVVRRLAETCREDYPGAVPVGLHLEGPFISSNMRGTQQECVRDADPGELRDLLEAGNGKIRIMTFAPERKGCIEIIPILRDHGVIPSMGHTAADGETTLRAVEAGATRCTHFYNRMPLLAHRDIYLTTVALTDDRISIELIVDGILVHPRMIDLVCRAKTRDRLVAVSDAVQGTGLGDGLYRLGSDRIRIADGASRRVSDGLLAGSCLPLDRAVVNLVRFSSLTHSEAVACATVNAARSIGLTDRGVIQPGKRADIVVLDRNGRVRLTIVRGRVVYDSRTQLQQAAADGETS